MTEPYLVQRKEAARLLGVSLRTLQRLIVDKEIPVKRVRSMILVSRRSLEKFAERS
jgi:excisionase family DNA binding protein